MATSTDQYVHLEELNFTDCSWQELDAHETYFRESLIPVRDAIPDSIAYHGPDGEFTKLAQTTLVRALLCLHRLYVAKALKAYTESIETVYKKK